jgi:hypothetical protein
MAIEISDIPQFPADRIGSKTHPTRFGRNVMYLIKLKIGFSSQFAKALDDPEHPLSKFFSAIDLKKDIRTAAAQTALWLTELSTRYDAFASEHGFTQVVRIMSKRLDPPDRGHYFALYFLEPQEAGPEE